VKILVYGINYSPELTGIGKYTGEMARWFASNGHDVRVVTAPPYYPEWQVHKDYSSYRFKTTIEENVRVTRCPIYIPKADLSALRRVLHLASFAVSSGFALLSNIRWKPDLIIQLAPTMFCCPATVLCSKFTSAKTALHIQDFEVDALFGLGMVSGSRLKSLAFSVETFLYRRFDRVSSISPSMVERLKLKGVKASNTLLFPNWSEISRFKDAKKQQSFLEKLGITVDKKVLLYSGNLGEKQGLEDVIDAADRLKDNDSLVFLVVGEGASKKRLVERATAKRLSNVIFAPLQPYELLPTLLASADVHLVVQKKGAADAVLPSKLTNILAVGGNSVITADPETSLGQLCSSYSGIAKLVAPENVDALVEGIGKALTMPADNDIATSYAIEFLDKETILDNFLKNLKAIS